MSLAFLLNPKEVNPRGPIRKGWVGGKGKGKKKRRGLKRAVRTAMSPRYAASGTSDKQAKRDAFTMVGMGFGRNKQKSRLNRTSNPKTKKGKMAKTKKSKAKRKRKSTSKWARCLRASGGNAKVASGLLKKYKGCKLPKGLADKIKAKRGAGFRARYKSATVRAAAERAARARAAKASWEAAETAKFSNNPRRKKKVAKKAKRRKTRKGKRRSKNPLFRVKKGKSFKAKSKKTGKKRKYTGGDYTGHKRKGKTKRLKRAKSGRGWKGNPRKKRHKRAARRRSNPFGFGFVKDSFRSLTTVDSLSRFGAGAAGAIVSKGLGNLVSNNIRRIAGDPSFIAKDSLIGAAVDTFIQVAVGFAIGGMLPEKYRGAWKIGVGIGAVQGIVQAAIARVPGAAQIGLAGNSLGGLGDYLTLSGGMDGYLAIDPNGQMGVSGYLGVAADGRMGTAGVILDPSIASHSY